MKKIAGIVLTAAMMIAMSTSAFAAFSDMPAGVDGEVIQKAVDNGLIAGFEDGTVQPATAITRAQMATIMSRAMRAQEKADITAFTDVKEGEWYYEAMAQAVNMGAFKGDDKNCLNPNNTITRQEAFIVLSRIFDLPSQSASVLDKYSDASSVASWAKNEVSAVVGGGYADSDTLIRPLDAMTRLEFAKVMDKLVALYIDAEGEYTTLPAGNVLVRAEGVVFKGVTSDKAVFIGDGVKGNTEFTDCVMERIIIRGGRGVLNSGTYTNVRAIGNGTQMELKKNPSELVKKFEDGTTGKFFAQSGKGVIILPQIEVEIQ